MRLVLRSVQVSRPAARRLRAQRRPLASMASMADGDESYRTPPPAIAAFAARPDTPGLSLSPRRDHLLYLHRPSAYVPVAELARPELKLAGSRFDAEQNTRSRMGYNTGLALAAMQPGEPPGEPRPVQGIPAGSWLNFVSWSPDGRHIAFTVRGSGEEGAAPRGRLALWVCEVATALARPLLPGFELNTTLDDYSWVDNETLVALVVPPGRGPAPARPPTPRGPRISTSSAGVNAQARTYPDLLKDAHDAATFTHLCTSEVVRVSLRPGAAPAPLGRGAQPRLYCRLDASPDGAFIIVEYLEPPFSYTVPASRFPKRCEVWRCSDGALVREHAALPLAESIPIVNDSCRPGPRATGWRQDAPASLCWTEAQDGGDPRVAASPRDIVYLADVRAGGAAVELLRSDWRCSGVSWGDGRLALAYDSQYKSRTIRTWAIAPDAVLGAAAAGVAAQPLRLLIQRNYEDAYSDPGAPMRRRTADGSYVLAVLEPEGLDAAAAPPGELPGRRLLFTGTGAGPEGNRPFLDEFCVDSGKPLRRLFACGGEASLEYVSSIVSDAAGGPIALDGLRVLMTRETPSDVPQYHVLSFAAGAGGELRTTECRLSDFPHPHPHLVAPPKEIIRYKRADGVDLSATLYTPPGWVRGVDPPLPTLLWAYPREFKTKDSAGQLRDSPHRFTSIGALSPLVWLAAGFAVLDGPTLPIVANGEEESNDTYVQQLTAGAEAAVAEAVRLGVAAPGRVAVGGRSYGAFMTANLLAHCPHLFCCGVAQAGAYNRTLTPFGFQAEERTLWQAPETYTRMSPFTHADRIKTPLLLIHGEEDTNTGTFPMQSERFFAALKGHGCETRLVLLPHESHSYSGLESVLHVLAEMSAWLERHTAVKPPPAPPAAGVSAPEPEMAAV